MSLSPLRLLSLVVVVLVASSGCDERCNTSSCSQLRNECRLAFEAEPNWALCDVDNPSDTVRDEHCAAACVVQDRGEVLECFSEKALSCEANRNAVIDQCLSGTRPAEPKCKSDCTTARTECESRCKLGKGCLDCASRCGLAFGRCITACPRQ